MRILITGTGFIASYVAKKLLDTGDEVTLYGYFENPQAMANVIGDLEKVGRVKGDVLETDHLIRTVKEREVDAIVHTAAVLIAGARENPFNAVKVNVLGTASVLEAARTTDAKKVVYTSSGNVYSMLNPFIKYLPPEGGLVKEDDQTIPGSVYGTTKLASELLGLNHSQIYGIDFVALRLPTVYGGWLGAMGLASVVRDMCRAALRSEPLTVEEYKSEWLHVKDAALACQLAVHSKNLKNRIFNIGTAKINSLREALDAISEELKRPINNITIKEVQRPLRYPVDISRAREELGFEPQFDFKSGVIDVLKWVRSYYV
ncbi:MAG: NAD(P)-dependent oxidoreductase [Thaumarchaeota archaeon]|nr:NAD(P)-dependent oxidoreductase [Candidatus Calditenuaceae archaeon]MDW8186694.1 NAD(P)-dependent oxidoreductase [Nitrososphaerota archaeon]